MSEKRDYMRAWTPEEILKPIDFWEQVKLSDKLADQVRALMFGRHPGVQLLTIADLAAIWVQNHPVEMRSNALAQMIAAIRDLAKIPHEQDDKNKT